jgi:hypothetical protein
VTALHSERLGPHRQALQRRRSLSRWAWRLASSASASSGFYSRR